MLTFIIIDGLTGTTSINRYYFHWLLWCKRNESVPFFYIFVFATSPYTLTHMPSEACGQCGKHQSWQRKVNQATDWLNIA